MKSLPSLFLISILLLIGCGTDENDVVLNEEEPKSKLISATKMADISVSELEQSFDLVFSSSEVASLKNNLVTVSAYKIIYQTPHPYFPNVQIDASGLVLLPDYDNPLPFLSLQHGTIVDTNEVPSSLVASSVSKHYLSVLAGLKYIVVAPDYIGYGESNNLLHPYEHGHTLAQSSYDMLVAVKDFLEGQTIEVDDKLFLAGYSEGGYATMALHKYIEDNTNTTVTASIVGGGAYNKTLFAKEIMQKNEALDFMPNYLWVLYTYNNLYGINEPFSFYIQQDQLANINLSNFFDSDNINTNPQELFTENFRNLILNEGQHPMIDAIKDNDRFDWQPKSLVYILHGESDDFVFPSNATTAYEAMKTGGVSNINLLLKDGQNHADTALEFAIQVPIIFEELR